MKENNVIDLSQHRVTNANGRKLKDNLKMRLDLEQAKVLVTTSLISVLFIVTLANNSIMSARPVVADGSSSLSSRTPASLRDPAAVPLGTSQWEDDMVARMAKLDVSEVEKVGRRPSSIDRLTFEFLEGKYAVRLENGKINELEFSDGARSGDRPKYVNDRARFLEENRDLLPVQFSKSVIIDAKPSGAETVESYSLVNSADVTVAKVEFHLDSSGRLLSMKVVRTRVAAN